MAEISKRIVDAGGPGITPHPAPNLECTGNPYGCRWRGSRQRARGSSSTGNSFRRSLSYATSSEYRQPMRSVPALAIRPPDNIRPFGTELFSLGIYSSKYFWGPKNNSREVPIAIEEGPYSAAGRRHRPGARPARWGPPT